VNGSFAKLALLQALLSAPGFGLELIERVKGLTGGRLKLFEGSVYPALRDLERDRLIVACDGNSRAGGRPPRHYRLTDEGRRVAKDDRVGLLMLVADG
jgi:DNA-binding PadR family transcriptional regulator